MYCTCHICHVYGICRSKEGGGGALKSSFGVAMQAISEGAILIRNGEEGGSNYVILLH